MGGLDVSLLFLEEVFLRTVSAIFLTSKSPGFAVQTVETIVSTQQLFLENELKLTINQESFNLHGLDCVFWLS